MDDYVLTYTEDTEPFSLYLRVSEYVAAVFAQALKDDGFTDVSLVCNTVVASPVTGKPTKKATSSDKGGDTKDKTA